ncbi:hypothetical protein Bint_1401 [Brachyspira intermedia PWS/A]|uniref:Peptidase M30, hyicolysin n=1 Tax=Brachyspira intermedia (strain ATCC 51140 / PWS/A) TaxID=1045858 RepID=G0EPW0_BRAIP|nr:hypothetical protein [Brachyspira intermedia]AEM22020.1 hypothetical protein Bint_1401 [Brachyspira intermedia PWS/A]
MKKLLFIYLSIFTVFIVSCGNKVLNPSESVDGITYYDVNNAETAKFNISVFYDDPNKPEVLNDIEFKKIAESGNAIVYIQSGQSFDINNVKKCFNKFEANYDEEVKIYGEPISFPNINNDKVVFLIYDFYPKSDLSGTGFSNSDDLQNNAKTINHGKYLYIHSKYLEDPDNVAATMMHEFQHLINASVNLMNGKKAMDLWLNEALSESTSVLFAPAMYDNRASGFNSFPYYSFYSWYIQGIIPINGLIQISYCSSSIFMKWIEHVGGIETINKIAHSSPLLDTRTRLVNSVKGLNIGNSVEEIFISWIKDIYKGNLPGVQVTEIPLDPNNNPLIIPGQGFPLVPGAFIIYNANKYNLNNTSIKTELLDAEKNIYLAWNPNFDSVDVEGTIDPSAVMWINATPK